MEAMRGCGSLDGAVGEFRWRRRIFRQIDQAQGGIQRDCSSGRKPSNLESLRLTRERGEEGLRAKNERRELAVSRGVERGRKREGQRRKGEIEGIYCPSREVARTERD
jgi:hypothetical protein